MQKPRALSSVLMTGTEDLHEREANCEVFLDCNWAAFRWMPSSRSAAVDESPDHATEAYSSVGRIEFMYMCRIAKGAI